jgi:hypothetical protein
MKVYKHFSLLLLVFLSLSVSAQRADSTNLMGKIIGTWLVQAEFKNSKNMSPVDSTKLESIKFRLDGHFIWRNGIHRLDSGSFHSNEEMSELFLESIRDRKHPQAWIVTLKNNDFMTLRGMEGSKFEGIKYECIKVKDGIY